MSISFLCSFSKIKIKNCLSLVLKEHQLKYIEKSMIFNEKRNVIIFSFIIQSFATNKITRQQVFCVAVLKIKWKIFYLRFLKSTNSNFSTKSMTFDSRIKIGYLPLIVQGFTSNKITRQQVFCMEFQK